MYRTGIFLFGTMLATLLSLGQASAVPLHPRHPIEAVNFPNISFADSSVSSWLVTDANRDWERSQQRELQRRERELRQRERAHQRNDRLQQERMIREQQRQNQQLRPGEHRRDHRNVPHRDNRGKGPRWDDRGHKRYDHGQPGWHQKRPPVPRPRPDARPGRRYDDGQYRPEELKRRGFDDGQYHPGRKF